MTSDNSNSSDNEIYLVDGSGYIFRAYYAIMYGGRSAMSNPQGIPVGAVFGFTNMMLKLLSEMKATHIAVIFDAARKNFRNDIYPEYKANRKETPEDLIPQFPLVREAAKSMGVPTIEMEGYEADDLIATYTTLARKAGKKVTIVSSDKDLMQLVTDGVQILDPAKQKFIDAKGVMEKFGVTPDKVIDVQALAGDSSDNIPGVPGIGIKTAASLINEYGSLEELLQRAGEIKQPKRRQALIDNADKARISKQLVTLVTDVNIPIPLEDIKAHNHTREEFTKFLQEQGFKSILSRIGENQTQTNTGQKGEATPTFPPIKENEYTLVTEIAQLQKWVETAYKTGFLAIDTETTDLTPAKAKLVGISLAAEIGKACYIPVGHTHENSDLLGENKGEIKQLSTDEVIKTLKPVLEDKSVLKIGQNIKYDWQMLAKHDVHMTPCDDTMLLSYVLEGTKNSNSMDKMSKRLLKHTPIKFEEVAGKGKNQVTFDCVPLAKALDYAAEDAEITLRLHKILKPRIAREKLATVYENIERPLIPVMANMELAGIKIDSLMLKEMSQEFGKKLKTLEAKIHELAGTTFNVASPKQIGEILFGQMGLEGGKKTKSGQWATGAGMLEEMAADENSKGREIAATILEWRQLSKLKTTYTDALQNEINPKTGRVHTSFHMAGTSTGRLSSSNPNLQNIPIRSEEGRKIRKAFIADKGHLLLSVDYSQVELRLVAALADVKALKQAFEDGIDIHAHTASQVFGVSADNVTPELRSRAKAVNFGIIYGISGWGLAKQLNCTPADANEFIRKYLNVFPEIKTYMEEKKQEARKKGYVKTLYGRKCFIHNIDAKIPAVKHGAERAAINAPIQGTAADIIKMAMIEIPPALEKEGLAARMLLQVHDEVILEVPEKEIDTTIKTVKHIMENVADIGIPLIADAGYGKNWGDAH